MQNYTDIKIPYPNEGVIRTAQLDDTVAPTDSAQLAVNMNFDRIGAVETRLGVESFTDSLVEQINNYGTLNNITIPAGFGRIVEVGVAEEFATEAAYMSAAKVDSSHIVVFYTGVDNDGFARVLSVNLTTGVLTPVGSALEFDTGNAIWNTCIQVDSTHFMNIWAGPGSDGFVQIFQVSAGPGIITALGTALEFDATNGEYFTVAQIDSSHFICFYSGPSGAGIATVFAVNLGTWAVTEPGAPFTFDASGGFGNGCVAIGDGTHFMNFWGTGFCQVFEVNTGTWGITTAGAAHQFDPIGSLFNSPKAIGDGTHFINFWSGSKAGGNKGLAQIFEVNTGTWAITEPGTYLAYGTNGFSNSSVSMGDGEHFVNFWGDASFNYTQIFEVDNGTWAITAIGQSTLIGEAASTPYNSAVFMSASHVVDVWQLVDGSGVGGIFRLDGLPIEGNYLYAGYTDKVANRTTGAWTVRRSGLAEVSKPRFSQFLNYIWMVNGNAAIGGDAVATSNGGAFGTTLVPAGFPSGDFIHGGFEGRVWIVDKTFGVIYYTDIVQFTPPDVYTLSYDPTTNFISNLSPQDGQTFTGVYRVPRALLVFTQDHIYRIYGATSVDAYPAYNVGTYSQESIVETKTGIFFHHSSGFYQFDYGSQPVEISRRIIDFIQAIPKAQYEDIIGVWDGFDAVEWYVGPVTVEGVTYSNCMARFTISTQVWTIYDYTDISMTAMIRYDTGTDLVHLAGDDEGRTGSLDTGFTDYGQPFYYEYIDRWRAFTDLYSSQKSISGINIYSENAAGANFMYQVQKAGANAWEQIGCVDENNNSLFPNAETKDFDVLRFRLTGTTKGTPIVLHGIEILSLTEKGFDQN